MLAHPKANQIQTAINAAITAYQSMLSSVGTATILFDVVSSGLGNCFRNIRNYCFLNIKYFSLITGHSNTYLASVSYKSYRQKLVSFASGTNDQIALANLPDQTNDPVMNYPNMWLKYAHARTLGYSVETTAQDSTVTINVDICNMDRVTIDPTKYVSHNET